MSDDSIEIIRFGKNNPSLEDYESIFWAPGTTKYVEFFTNQQVSITVVDLDNSSQLTESLANLIDGHPMSIDFEWKPDTSNSNNPISLFQIGSSKGVLIVLNSQKIIGHGKDHRTFDFFNECPEGLSIMKEFLNSNLFYGKGMSCDRKKLKQLFSQTFEMEDIDTTRLQPHELTSNFSELVIQLIGKPDAKFKDQNISKSNWNNRPLSVKQVLYAAFDAYATRLFLNYFITKYGEEEFIDPSTVQIDKTSKKSKKQKNKNQKNSANDDDDNDNSKKKKNNESSNKQNQKNFKPKFDIKVKFHSADDFLYLLDDKDYNDFGIEFNEIKKDSDDFVQTGVFPSGYNPRKSLKRRILCLEDIFELPDESETPNYFCKLCNSKIDSSFLDDHIWMNHYDQLPFVYFPDQVPTYIEKCMHTVYIACSNFKFVEKEGEKNESSNEDKEESKTKNISESSESNNDKDKNDDKKSIKLSGDFYELEKEVVCTLCDHNFPSFSTFFAHIQHMHSSKSLSDKFEMSVKEILFYYFNKVKLFVSDTHFCRLCGKKVDDNEQDIDHCWRFHGEDVVKMLKHRPNRYTQKCFESCFPFGVMSIHPMNAGQMFKGSIACSFCKIGFDDPGELFVHLFHRHTRAIAVKNSDMDKWPLHASDLHPEFLEIMEMWCYQSAVDALSDESVGIIQEIDEDENEKEDDKNKNEKEDDKSKNEKEDDKNKNEKEDDKNKDEKEDIKSKNKKDDDKSTMKKKKNKKKKFRNTNKILYRCNECKDDDDAQEEFHSPKQLWNHIVKNHLIILFDFIA